MSHLVHQRLHCHHTENSEKASLDLSEAPEEQTVDGCILGWIPQPVHLPELCLDLMKRSLLKQVVKVDGVYH